MRKDDRPKDEQRGKVKFRVIEFELEGSNSSLQESLRSIATALSGPVQTSRQIIERPQAPALPAGRAPAVDADEAEIVDEQDLEEDGSPAASSANKPNRRSRPRSPIPLELDFTKASITLKDFCATKNPKSDTQKYLVISFWLKEQLGIPEVTMDHIYTAYRHLSWNTPDDASAPLRNMKSTQYGFFVKGEAKGSYRLIHTGENAVNSMGGK